MATQYTSILKLALPVQGELSGTWGDVVNNNITSMVEEAVAGRSVINSWSGNSHTLTTADGTTAEARAAILEFTDTSTDLSGAATVICPAASKVYICKNGSGQQVTVKTASGTGIAIPNGKSSIVFCDGTNVNEAVTNLTALDVSGAVTATGVITGLTVEATGDTAAGDNAAMGYTSAEGLILTGQGSTNDVTIKNDADADVLEIPTGTTNVTVTGDIIAAGTLQATGDTAAGDAAAIGYTSAEGLILTGQGSTNDVTIKNDADADVLEIPTGTTNVTVVGDIITAGTLQATGDTAAGDDAAIGYTSAEGIIITGQGSSTDVTIKNDADTTVMSIATGTTQATFAGEVVAASLDISGNIDVDGTTNLDAVDIDGAVDMASTLTVAGVLTGASLDISGDIDVDGTTNLDAVDIDGAVQIDNTVTVGADDTGYDVKFFGATSGAYMLWDEDVDDLILAGAARIVIPDGQLVLGSTAVTATAAELNAIDLGGSVGTVVASKVVTVDSNKDVSSFRNITLTGELDAGSLDISGDIDVDGTTNLDVVDIDGAVDMASTLTVGGVVTANAGVVVDNITIDGTEIDLSSGDLTLDVAGDIILDADGAQVRLYDAGTEFGVFSNESNNLIIKSQISDADLLIKGNDGGTGITALTFDMSAAGAATFNDKVTATDIEVVGSGGSAANRLKATYNSSSGVAAFGPDSSGGSTSLQIGTSNSGTYAAALTLAAAGGATFVGEVAAASLDISGNVDIDGTTNLDVVDIDGAVNMASTLTSGTDVGVNSEYAVLGDDTSNRELKFSQYQTGGSYDNAGHKINATSGYGELALAVGGTNALTLDASQNATFAGNLDVDGSAGIYQRNSSGGSFVLDDTDTADASTPMVYLRNTAGQLTLGRANRNASTGLTTSSTDSLTISNAGNVGIGTASPNHNLHVYGASGSITNMTVANPDVALRMSAYGSSHSEIRVETNHDLLFKTNGNNEKMRIEAGGNVGIGTSSVDAKLHVQEGGEPGANGTLILEANGSNRQIRISPPSDAENGSIDYRGGNLLFKDDGSEVMRFSASGSGQHVIAIGHSTVESSIWAITPRLQIEGTNASTGAMSIVRNTNSSSPPYLVLTKTRGGVNGSDDIVQDNDFLGQIVFSGADGTDRASQGGSIACRVDGTPGTGDMPGRLEFFTTQDGAETGTIALTLNSSQNATFAGTVTCTSVTETSDAALKTDVQPIKNALDTVSALKGVTYKDKKTGDKRIGFIAQDVQADAPDLAERVVLEADPETKMLGINYSHMTSVLAEAIKEQQTQIEFLMKRIKELED